LKKYGENIMEKYHPLIKKKKKALVINFLDLMILCLVNPNYGKIISCPCNIIQLESSSTYVSINSMFA
jgi:hypothetical protein